MDSKWQVIGLGGFWHGWKGKVLWRQKIFRPSQLLNKIKAESGPVPYNPLSFLGLVLDIVFQLQPCSRQKNMRKTRHLELQSIQGFIMIYILRIAKKT